jgi:phosphonate transport system permease protein
LITTYSSARRFVFRFAVSVAFLAIFYQCAVLCDLRAEVLWQGVGKAPDFLGGFFPPMWSATREIVDAVVLTLLLASIATIFGLLLAFPVGLAAAKNVAPVWLRLPVRILMGVERALPDILALLFFIVAFGLGPFAGILALSVQSVGMLGKLMGDAIEEIDLAVMDGVQAVGASRWQVLRYGVLPQVLPALAANTLFRFDVNVRSSVLLGAVGAGGVGAEIFRSMGMLRYDRATLAVLGSLVLIYSAEMLSGKLRQRLMGESAA